VSFSEISKSQFFLIAFSFLFSLIYFFTLPFSPYSFDFVFKGTSILLIGVFALSNLKSWTRFFIGFSFLFATTGDVFLTFIHKKYFLFGLCCFHRSFFLYSNILNFNKKTIFFKFLSKENPYSYFFYEHYHVHDFKTVLRFLENTGYYLWPILDRYGHDRNIDQNK
jgi:hypothetical protein